jgi:hypothetical protein
MYAPVSPPGRARVSAPSGAPVSASGRMAAAKYDIYC